MFDKKTFGKYIANFKLAFILTEVLPYKAEQGTSREILFLLQGKCLQGFTGTFQGNRSVEISNLRGLHVYLQSL